MKKIKNFQHAKNNGFLSMKKKAQMQMGESIAIIVIVLILIIFGLVFYARVKAVSIDQKASLFEELDIVTVAQIAYSLPEVQCSFAEVVDYGCVDLLKFKFLGDIIKNSFTTGDDTFFYYRNIFGRSKISMQIINYQSTQELILYDAGEGRTQNNIRMPLNAYNPIMDENLFAVLVVESYE